MTFLYQLAVLGDPTNAQLDALSANMVSALGKFSLRLGHDVGWEVLPTTFKPHQLHPSAAVFFVGKHANLANLEELLKRGIPVLPVISGEERDQAALPKLLQPLNCLNYADGGAEYISAALLECVGLLAQQRRVFISYRRDEAAEAAMQLFDALSARHFDVFLDSHGTAPAAEVEALSWHRLYDSDVLLMLDTPAYFDNRWTSAEFGRVLAKGVSILRVGWPGTTPSLRSATACLNALSVADIHPESGRIGEDAIERICLQLEKVRGQNYAVRYVNLISRIRIAIQAIGGKMLGVGSHKAVHLELLTGEHLTVYPTAGVPTPFNLQDALSYAPDKSVAVVYDPVGLSAKSVRHLDWLETHEQSDRWIKATEASWEFKHWRHK